MKEFTNVIVIDASGSMSSKRESVRKGLRDLFKEIKKQAKRDSDVKFNTIVVDFSGNGDIRTLVESSDPSALTKEMANDYDVRGLTALYDAIGYAFNKVDKKQKSVFFNILTDGQENNSSEFTADDIKKLIKKGRKRGWGITFMGTDEDAITSATSLGISKGNTYQFADSSAGVSGAWSTTLTMAGAYYSATIHDNDDVSVDNLTDVITDENEGS